MCMMNKYYRNCIKWQEYRYTLNWYASSFFLKSIDYNYGKKSHELTIFRYDFWLMQTLNCFNKLIGEYINCDLNRHVLKKKY